MSRLLVWLVLLCLACVAGAQPNELARGWGDYIEWETLEDARAGAQDTGKPIMVLIHKTWCGACKNLKPKFADSDEIFELSEQFHMVNCEDQEEPEDEAFRPDGGYIPRILFLGKDGQVKPELINDAGNPAYQYYYPQTSAIVASMQRALEIHGTGEWYVDTDVWEDLASRERNSGSTARSYEDGDDEGEQADNEASGEADEGSAGDRTEGTQQEEASAAATAQEGGLSGEVDEREPYVGSSSEGWPNDVSAEWGDWRSSYKERKAQEKAEREAKMERRRRRKQRFEERKRQRQKMQHAEEKDEL